MKVAYVMIQFTWQSQKDTALWLPEVRSGGGCDYKGSPGGAFWGEDAVLYSVVVVVTSACVKTPGTVHCPGSEFH